MNAAVPSLPVASHGLYLDKKEQLVSIIISPKMQSEGHRLRQDIVSRFGSTILNGHIFGVSHRKMQTKVGSSSHAPPTGHSGYKHAQRKRGGGV